MDTTKIEPKPGEVTPLDVILVAAIAVPMAICLLGPLVLLVL